MSTVQVKDVPEDVHATFKRRAAEAGQSLQEYVLGLMLREARRPTVDEVLDRAGNRSGGSISREFVVEHLRHERDAR